MASGRGWGSLGGAEILQKIMAPLSVINLVKYFGVGGGGGAKILQKIMPPPPPYYVIKIVKYRGFWGGGGHWGAPKYYKT